MAEANQYTFSYQELVEMMLKRSDVHEGLWMIWVQFNLQASNLGASASALTPSAIVNMAGIGIQRVPEGFPTDSNLSVDAAKVNPKPRGAPIKGRR